MKPKKRYECKVCGHHSPAWTGKCPSCQNWGSIAEVEWMQKDRSFDQQSKLAISLPLVPNDHTERLETTIGEFNRVLGGGLVRDSVSILTAKPGAGKSTLLLELAEDFANNQIPVLYISGEESEAQIKSRAMRIMNTLSDKIWIISTNSMDEALENIKHINPAVVILDSIQTFRLREYPSRAGSPIQTIECANALVEIAKNKNSPKAVIMVGHMTKSDEMAGLRTLEHLVDTVLYLEGDTDESLRVLTTTKNRFGRIGEIGLFSMEDYGIQEIKDPSDYFITRRQIPVPGSALAMIKEGSRMMIVEVESLVSKSYSAYPTRIGDSLRKDQLNTLISILEERGGMNLNEKNVILKTTGGLRLSEQSVNLAVIMSIVSSLKMVAIPQQMVFIAEVGLTGELKRIPHIENRLYELDRLGYSSAVIAKGTIKDQKNFHHLTVLEFEYLWQVIQFISSLARA